MTVTQADIKKLVEYGAAKDISKGGELPKGSRKIFITKGAYGINGALFISKSGNLYAITSRSSQLDKYV